MSFKICLIGCGRHASDVHGPSLRQYAADTPGVELAAVCDLDRTRAEAFAREFGFGRVYADVDVMVKAERPQAVSVVLPPSVAGRVCGPLLDAGIPVLIEKPPAATARELVELTARATRGGASVQVGFNRRYAPLLAEVHRVLEVNATPEMISRIDYEMIRCDRRDADFSTTAIHALDTVLFLARSPYERVWIEYQELPEQGPGVANIEVSGVCRSGTRVRISFLPVAGMVMERAAVYGTGQSWLVEMPLWGAGGRVRHWKAGELLAEREEGEQRLFVRAGFAAENRAFFEAVRAGRKPAPDLREAEQSVILMEAIRNRVREINFATS